MKIKKYIIVFQRLLRYPVIQSEAKNLGNINLDATEILPPYGLLKTRRPKFL